MTQQAINLVTLVGRAGRDPEVKYLDTGSVVANFSVAVDRPTKAKETDWFDLELWENTAEVAANHVRKGKLIGVTGSLTFQTWIDKVTGEERSKPVIKVKRLDLLGSKKDNEQPTD